MEITGKLTADGSAVSIDFGSIPTYFMVINANAADTEVIKIEWFQRAGDSVELWHYYHENDGGGDVATPVWKSSGGYISEKDTTTVDTSNPVQHRGCKGITIAADFMDDSDVLYFLAIKSDRDVNLGDAADVGASDWFDLTDT